MGFCVEELKFGVLSYMYMIFVMISYCLFFGEVEVLFVYVNWRYGGGVFGLGQFVVRVFLEFFSVVDDY